MISMADIPGEIMVIGVAGGIVRHQCIVHFSWEFLSWLYRGKTKRGMKRKGERKGGLESGFQEKVAKKA